MQEIVDIFLSKGASLVPSVLCDPFLSELREFCTERVVGYMPSGIHKDSPAAPVSPDVPQFLAAIQRGAEALEGLGFKDIRFHSGALIPKWLGEGRRGFHVDAWYFETTLDMWREIPPQVGLLCYLDDAREDTGALIIVPTSHRREVIGHYEYWESWRAHPDEEILPADAGDAILLNPACMHGVTGNSCVPNRMCLTLWFMLDFGALDPRTRATVMLSIPPTFKQHLGKLCPEYGGPARYYSHVKHPQFPITFERISALRHGLTDVEIIGGARQPGDTFIDTDETYTWYRAIAAAKAPKQILELGVRYGYSGIAMLQGARWAGAMANYVGVDGEVDGVVSSEIARLNLRGYECIQILKLNTRNVDIVNAGINGLGTFDIVHIDGNHSVDGVRNEMGIALMWSRPKGLIVVDDCDVPHIKAAVDKLCADYGIDYLITLPTRHTTCVVDLSRRTKF